jgi:hypothetical protein
MNLFTPPSPPDRRRRCGSAVRARRALASGAASVALLLATMGANAAYVLAPQYAGTFAAGSGADAEFHRIQNDWMGSAVLWDETRRAFGSGVPVGSFGWGTGLWGQVDWRAVQQAAAGEPSAASGAIVQSFAGVLGTINQGNSRYNECYSASWGTAALVPFFAPAAPLGNCSDPEAGDPAQQNWTARYTGFIRITDPGEYNFSVLHDDGFFFRLVGAGGSELGIGRDFLNPRDRVGFDQNLALDAGLYGFELGAWNRLGAGVVDLRWTSGCADGCGWTLVPTANLWSTSEVPEPPVAWLAMVALLGLWLARARPRPPRWLLPRCSRTRT